MTATEFRLTNPVISLGAHKPKAQDSRIGQKRFFTLKSRRLGKRVIEARLKARGKHAYVWVDLKSPIKQDSAIDLISYFDEQIYPKNMRYFARPPVRSQISRADILITDLGQVDGYFDPGDLSANDQLNLIQLDSDVAENEPAEALNTLAHEFAHLLYYKSDGADIGWLDEGLAVYAEHINNGQPRVFINQYRQNPNVKLAGKFSGSDNHYGAAYLFIAFAAKQVESSNNSVPEFIQALIMNSEHGTSGINSTLEAYIHNRKLDSLNEIYREQLLIDFANQL